MRKLLSISNPLYLMAAAFSVFLILATLGDGEGLNDSSKILLTVTSFVFGFYINSLIAQSRNRHAKVVDSLREEGGHIKAIYYMAKGTLSKEDVSILHKEIDNYLTTCMDYRTADYSESSVAFRELFDVVMKLKPESKQQDITWGHMVRIVGEISKARTRIEALVKERVSLFEWSTTAILLALVIYFVFALNTGGLISVLVTSFIATSLTMLIIILHGLDSLKWKEDKWFWVPVEELFIGLDLLPYYPQILIDSHRLKLDSAGPVRLAQYPNPYPDVSDKVVTVRK